MTREDTPDLLASMFGEKKTPAPPSKKPPVPARKAKPAKAVEPEKEPPIRCTHYLTRDTAAELPMTQGRLLQLTTLQKRDVSNSNVVEAALRMAFADLEANGYESDLVYYLSQIAQEE